MPQRPLLSSLIVFAGVMALANVSLGDSKMPTQADLIGNWTSESAMTHSKSTYSLTADGTISEVYDSWGTAVKYEGTWKVQDNKLTLVMTTTNGKKNEKDYTVVYTMLGLADGFMQLQQTVKDAQGNEQRVVEMWNSVKK